MSHLHYSHYPGFGERGFNNAYYSQAVRVPVGETVTISGQGGWDRDTGEISPNLDEEIEQAFDNVHHALLSAGGPGMSSVYKLVLYYTSMSQEARNFALENRKKWFPDHRPIVTAIGVEKLAFPAMRIEIEAWAHLGGS